MGQAILAATTYRQFKTQSAVRDYSAGDFPVLWTPWMANTTNGAYDAGQWEVPTNLTRCSQLATTPLSEIGLWPLSGVYGDAVAGLGSVPVPLPAMCAAEPPGTEGYFGRAYFDRVAAEIVHTQSIIRISAADLDRAIAARYIAPAIVALDARLRSEHRTRAFGAVVEIMWGQTLDQEYASLEDALKTVTAGLDDNRVVRVRVGLLPARGGNTNPGLHAKMVVRDEETAILGGINLREEYFTRYSDPSGDDMNPATGNAPPTNDLSIEVHGEAAVGASRAFEWMFREEDVTWRCTDGVEAAGTTIASECDLGAPVAPQTVASPLNVFTLARGGGLAIEATESSGDDALLAAVAATQSHLRIHDYAFGTRVPGTPVIVSPLPLFDRIRDMTRRGCVDVVLSKFVDPRVFISPDDAAAVLSGYLKDNDGDVCRLRMTRYADHAGYTNEQFHSDYNGPQAPTAHAKFFLFDASAFYVGSQNIAVGEMNGKQIPVPHYYEAAFVIDDEGAARKAIDGYWKDVWTNSYGTSSYRLDDAWQAECSGIRSQCEWEDFTAATCADILKAHPGAASGIYALTGRSGPWSTYCDMDSTHDGGGYTLVLKADGNTALFDWYSLLWSSDEGYPEDPLKRNAQAVLKPSGEARLDGYVTIPVNSVEIAMQESTDPDDPGYVPRFARITPPDAMRGQTLLQVFKSGTPYYTSHGSVVWNALLSNPSYQDECDIVQNHLEGFNIAYSDYGVATHARIGVLGDEAAGGCHDPDSALGVGIGVGGASNCCYPGGASTHESTVGNTSSNVFACGGNCSGFAGARDTKAFAYVLVR